MPKVVISVQNNPSSHTFAVPSWQSQRPRKNDCRRLEKGSFFLLFHCPSWSNRSRHKFVIVKNHYAHTPVCLDFGVNIVRKKQKAISRENQLQPFIDLSRKKAKLKQKQKQKRVKVTGTLFVDLFSLAEDMTMNFRKRNFPLSVRGNNHK